MNYKQGHKYHTVEKKIYDYLITVKLNFALMNNAIQLIKYMSTIQINKPI